jgi:hypothetical protein
MDPVYVGEAVRGISIGRQRVNGGVTPSVAQPVHD